MKTGQYTVAAIVATIASHGCLDPLAPDVGAPLQGPCRNEDSDPAMAVLYNTDIAQGIWQAAAGHCNNCHFPTAANPIGISTGGLDLSSYQALRLGGVRSATNIVVPGKPCDSVLLQKIKGAPFGARMPSDTPPLFAADIQRLHDWIAEGAHDN